MPEVRPQKTIFAIHDAHPWGGQDKYTLEIARWIAKKRDVEIRAYTVHGQGDFHFKKVSPALKRPVFLKSFYYHVSTWFSLRKDAREKTLINAMGACSLRSDIVQVLFLHKSWAALQKSDPTIAGKARSFLHGFYHQLLQKYDLWSERMAFTPEKKYIAISKTVGDEVTKYFPKIKSVSVVYPGIDPEVFRPVSSDARVRNQAARESLGIRPEELLFLFVGSFERKGLAVVLESLKRVQDQKWKLAVVGKGDIPRYQTLAREYGIEAKVIFLGSRKDVASFYQASDFFVFPTRYEPFGMVVLEAMACGCVPIVSACAGAAELIEDQENGVVIRNELSVDEISGILKKVLSDPQSFKNFAIAARNTAENYSWEQVADRYLSLMDQVNV